MTRKNWIYDEKLNNKTSKIDAAIKLLKTKQCTVIDNNNNEWLANWKFNKNIYTCVSVCHVKTNNSIRWI